LRDFVFSIENDLLIQEEKEKKKKDVQNSILVRCL